jgi:negative regulator of sigma E activity
MTGRIRRTIAIGSTLAVALAIAAPAMADDVDDDLADVLAGTHTSTYTATRLTVSVWGDQTSLVRERVEHAKGAEMIRVDETWSMVGNGRTIVMDDAPNGFAFMTTKEPVITDRYEIGEISSCTHLKRRCRFVEVVEDGLVRAHLLIDQRTGAPLITYLYDGQGRTYRTISLSDFSPHRTYEWPEGRTDVPVEVVMHDESASVPSELDGYQLVDVFNGPASSDQGYYSDGLFSFSLFTVPGGATVAGFDDATPFTTDTGVYDLLPSARDVRVHWQGGGREYVLVGDLPPDHLVAVLAELPAPDAGNLIIRLWRTLFG